MNNDFTYCLGRSCAIREHCRRYTEGQRLPDGDWWWMEHCDIETRQAYISNNL